MMISLRLPHLLLTSTGTVVAMSFIFFVSIFLRNALKLDLEYVIQRIMIDGQYCL